MKVAGSTVAHKHLLVKFVLNLPCDILIAMKVILLKDVPKLGQAGDVKDVANGYAQSMLIPNGLVEMATEKKLEALEKEKSEIIAASEAKSKNLHETLKDLNGKTVTLKLPVNEKGHLYQQVTVANIIEAIKKETGHELPESMLMLEKGIKEAGEHQIILKQEKSSAKLIFKIEAAN